MNHILLVQSDMLLSAGVERLLAHEGDFVVKSTPAASPRELFGEVVRFKPEVLVFDDSLAPLIAPLVLELFEFVPGLRILRVNYWTNHVHLYCYRDIGITGTGDLLAAVRTEMACPKQYYPFDVTS